MLQKLKNYFYRFWDHRFLFGLAFTGFNISANRYTNGGWLCNVKLGEIISSGTGHWPFTVFDASVKTGVRASWHITVLGLCMGTVWLSDTNEDGTIRGADYKKLYKCFLCINHKHKQLQELIS